MCGLWGLTLPLGCLASSCWGARACEATGLPVVLARDLPHPLGTIGLQLSAPPGAAASPQVQAHAAHTWAHHMFPVSPCGHS